MEFSNNNDVLIILNIKDRRGRNIRVSAVKDIKIKVWTHNPDCALTFDYRNIIQKRDCDTLLIKGSQMEALPSGVVTYSYSYKTFDNMPHPGHFHNAEHSEIVVTDIFWKNRHRETVIESPTYYHSLEFMKDLIERERNERIHQFKDLQYYVTQEYTNKLNDEVERATYREDELEAYINEVSGKTDSNYSELSEKIDSNYDDLKEKIEAEVKRSQDVDIHFLEIINELDKKYENKGTETDEKLDSENKRAEEAESQLQSDIVAETERAKAEEKRIEEKLDAEIARSKAEDVQTNLVIETEVTRAKQEEARIEARMEAEKARAMNREKQLQSDIDDEITRSKNVDEQIIKKQTELKDSFDELKNAVQDEIKRSQQFDEECEAMCKKSSQKVSDLETALNDEIARAKKKENNIKSKLEDEVSRATLRENELETSFNILQTKVDNNTNLIQNETSRAELVERDITEALQQLKQLVNSKNGDITATIEALRNELYAEINRSETEDENINRLLEILNGDENVIGSVLHSIKDAEHRINDTIEDLRDEVEEIIGGNLEEYATKKELADEIKKLLGEAPEAYDTLEKIARKLNEDDDVFAAIKSVLTEKANAEDVYTKSEIDRKEGDLSNVIQNEIQRATLTENGLQSQIDSFNSDYDIFKQKVNKHIADGDANYQEVYNAIVKEQTRAENEETKLQNQLDVINGDENTIGSIAHAISDANHYTDDEIEKVMHNVTDIETNINNHIQEAETNFNNIQNQLDEKQAKGDYVEYTTDNENRKHIILPNHCNIVGTTQDGTDGRNLIMLSKWNVVDIGSVNTPINLNGLSERPTYNDNKQIALMDDLDIHERITDEEILMCANQ